MKTLYLDLIAGASGDMFLGALIDAGVHAQELAEQLKGLHLDEFELQARKVTKNGFQATKVDVLVGKQPPERHLPEILEIISQSSLPPQIQERAAAIFQKIGEIEASIHNKSIDEIHLHELGGTDTIVDVTGTLLGLDLLEVSTIKASTIPVGSGFIQGAHGQIPLPAPATLGLLKGLPIKGLDVQSELVTPTGAALLAALVDEFGPAPAMAIEGVGYGAGTRDLPIPNLMRVLIGRATTEPVLDQANLISLETNLDDQNPEAFSYLMELLFEAGALDVCYVPIFMKKNRPGTQIQVLADRDRSLALKEILFRETSTLGIREQAVARVSLPREIYQVSTPYGMVNVKVTTLSTGELKVKPEYEDCRILALSNDLPLRDIYQAALAGFKADQES